METTNRVPDMMTVRRSALDEMSDRAHAATPRQPFAGIRVDLRKHLPVREPVTVTQSLVAAVTDRLARDGRGEGIGAAVVAGLTRYAGLAEARVFHEMLFRAVWEDFRRRSGDVDPDADYRMKTNVTSDGVIPPELYGSNWSFKQLHMDRDALLFSHLYGPVAGFTGGALLLVDVRTYMQRHRLCFDDLFGWSEEPTPGSKPVLREEHQDAALAECGIDLGAIGPDEIVFVNNCPRAGILHGVTHVVVQDPDKFVREFHRCSVKDSRYS